MFRLFTIFFASLVLSCSNIGSSASSPSSGNPPLRTFLSSFENQNDFSGFYIVPADQYASNQTLATDKVYDGAYSHKAWILGPRDTTNDGPVYSPHRAYPTLQFQKTAEGGFRTPCMVSIWVYLDVTLQSRSGTSDWFSFATFTSDSSDAWTRTVTVNVNPDGYIRLVHVPGQTDQQYLYQATRSNDANGALSFPYRNWVRLDVFLNFDATNGYAKVWQNKQLVSSALVTGTAGILEQAHFGLYASAAIGSGTVYNDKLRIVEVESENDAIKLLNDNW